MSLPAGTTWMYQGHPIRLVERENGLAGGEMVPLTETEDRVRLAHRVQRKRYSRHGDGDDGLPPEYDGLRERRIVSRDGAYDWIEYVPVRRPGTDRIVWKGTALALGLNAHDLKRMKLDKLPFGPLDGRKVPRQDPGRSPLLERLTAGDPQSHQPGKRPSDGPKLYQPEDEDETPPSRAIPAGRPPLRIHRPEQLRHRSNRIRYSQANFARSVLSTYPKARQINPESFKIPWKGGRTIFLNYDPVNQHVWIQFQNRGLENAFSHGKNLRPGSLALFRSLNTLVGHFQQHGLGVEFEASPKKLKTYHSLLERAGFYRTSPATADPVYKPKTQEPVQMKRRRRHARSTNHQPLRRVRSTL